MSKLPTPEEARALWDALSDEERATALSEVRENARPEDKPMERLILAAGGSFVPMADRIAELERENARLQEIVDTPRTGYCTCGKSCTTHDAEAGKIQRLERENAELRADEFRELLGVAELKTRRRLLVKLLRERAGLRTVQGLTLCREWKAENERTALWCRRIADRIEAQE